MAGALPALQTPYSTAMPYLVAEASTGWTDEYDRQRILSYDLYDDLFHNDPLRYRLMLRGSDEKPILVPTAGTIIKTLARYVGKNWGYKVIQPIPDPGEDAVEVTAEQMALAQVTFGKLFARERLLSRYRGGVPEWLRRGDWLWFVSADPKKRAGSRISVRPIDPRRYFPINGDPTDLSRVTGQQLIEEVQVGDKVALYVQTWLKASDPQHPDFGEEEPEDAPFDITYEADVYDAKDFGDPLKRQRIVSSDHPSVGQDYISGISQLPIYHIKNNEETDDPFGRSDLAGLESLISGINQAISDEDLSLALMGIGMYTTDSGAPIDETTGQTTDWKLGPNRVVETDEGTKFSKVDGIDSVQPFQDHVKYMKDEARNNAGVADVAMGDVGSSAFSGVALSIRFAPTLDAVKAKNDNSNGILTQMLHDLKDWFAAFEGIDLGDVDIISVTEDDNLLPFDRETRWKELMEGVAAGIITVEFAVKVLQDQFGYEFPSDYISQVSDAIAAKNAALDPFAARAGEELDADDDEPDEEDSEDDPEA